MTKMTELRHGRCKCGDVTFEVVGPTVMVEFCHCRSCRHAVGAPLMAWAAFSTDGFAVLAGEPVVYESSPGVRRGFCGRCGSSLTLTDERFDGEIYVALAVFDDADAPEPDFHIWRSERLAWLETADSLPRYRRFMGDGELE
ncbi:MAG: GFA family protein [Alphaproteobacteria bacterium]|jgi:hypothetical protein